MRADGEAPLLAARDATLYLVSLLAVASARIAWLDAGGGALLGQALFLALAALLGKLLADTAAGLWTSATRRRNRLLFLGGYAALAFIALLAATSGGEIVAREAEAFAFLHPALFLLAPLLGLEVAVLGNALLLVVLASLRGGAPAAVACTGFIGLMAFYLAFDHASRRLAAWPRARGRLLVPVAAGAARLTAPVVAALALLFVLAPPTPYDRIAAGPAGRSPRETASAYWWLGLIALGGAGTIVLLGRLLRSRGSEEGATLEAIEASQALDEPLEPPRPEEGVYAGPRAGVIRAYLRFLARARDQGWALPRHQTPREIQRRVRDPEGPLERLTALFMDARYGPGEPGADEVREAESAARAVVSALVGQRAVRGGRGRA